MKRSKIEREFIALQKKNNPIEDHTTIFCDLDNTLLMQDNLIKIPNKNRIKMILFGKEYYLVANDKNINFIKKKFKEGYTCILWSAAGKKWATQACKALKLQKYFKYILPKPYYYLDDKHPVEWTEVNLYQY